MSSNSKTCFQVSIPNLLGIKREVAVIEDMFTAPDKSSNKVICSICNISLNNTRFNLKRHFLRAHSNKNGAVQSFTEKSKIFKTLQAGTFKSKGVLKTFKSNMCKSKKVLKIPTTLGNTPEQLKSSTDESEKGTNPKSTPLNTPSPRPGYDYDSYFEAAVIVDDRVRRKCLLCGSSILISKNYAMKRHLERRHNIKLSKSPVRPHSNFSSPVLPIVLSLQSEVRLPVGILPNSSGAVSVLQNKKELDKAVTQLLVSEGLPFHSVNSPAFRRLAFLLNPDYELPSVEHISTTLLSELRDSVQNCVLESMTQAKSFTLSLDIWTAPSSRDRFLILSTHFIDDLWVKQSYCIGCVPFNESWLTKDEVPNSVIKRALSKFNLGTPTFVVINKAVMNPNNLHKLDLECQKHFSFSFESVNLTSMENCHSITEALEKARDISNAFKSLPNLWRNYCSLYQSEMKATVTPLRIPNDSNSCWTTTVSMLRPIIDQVNMLRLASEKLYTPELNVSKREQRLLDEVLTLLKPLEEAEYALCKIKNVTLSLIIPAASGITRALTAEENLLAETDEIRNSLLSIIKSTLSPFTSQVDCMVATYLDPRFKLKFASEYGRRIIRKTIQEFTDKQKMQSAVIHKVQISTKRTNLNDSRMRSRVQSNSYSSDACDATIFKFSDGEDESEPPVDSSLEQEMTAYERESREKDMNFCPLAFYREKQNLSPILSSAAKAYLSIPAVLYMEKQGISLQNDRNIPGLDPNIEDIFVLKRNLIAYGYTKDE